MIIYNAISHLKQSCPLMACTTESLGHFSTEEAAYSIGYTRFREKFPNFIETKEGYYHLRDASGDEAVFKVLPITVE